MIFSLRRIRRMSAFTVLKISIAILVLITVLFVALPLEISRVPNQITVSGDLYKRLHKEENPNDSIVLPTVGAHRRLAGQDVQGARGRSVIFTNRIVSEEPYTSPLLSKASLKSSTSVLRTGKSAVNKDKLKTNSDVNRQHLSNAAIATRKEDRARTSYLSPEKLLGNSVSTVERNLPASVKASQTRSSQKRPGKHSKQVVNRSACPESTIIKKHKPVISDNEVVACTPHKSPEEACVFAAKLYKHREDLRVCTVNTEKVNICKIDTIKVDKNFEVEFKCSPAGCDYNNDEKAAVSILSAKTGDLKQVGLFSNSAALQAELPFIAATTHSSGFNFIYLDCVDEKEDFIKDKSQIIVLPPRLPPRSIPKNPPGEKPIKFTKAPLSVNVILIDSVARAHFHRSMHDTLALFNELNSQKSGGEVLDFELFQSVDGHSAENAHALFTGSRMPPNITTEQKEGHPIGVWRLYQHFKKAGYFTTYMDDLCWHEVWGIRLDLGNSYTFKELLSMIRENSIDDTGITFASCKILDHNGVTMPFNGPDNDQLCYNGMFQHQYYLHYLTYLFSEHELLEGRMPRVAYSVINTAHDYTGRRIQTLDRDLAQFVRRMSKLKNTLTIILADHGNTYAEYTHAVLEGRYEMFHPSFFMVVPEAVSDSLGSSVMNALRVNQNRLFTMVDLHHTLKTIALEAQGKVSPRKGLFDIIPASRLCDDVPLSMPNLCVCEGWDTPTKNDSTQLGVLEVAVGTLNNMINDQRYDDYMSGKNTKFPTVNCVRLVPKSFYNVRERNSGEYLITTLDFSVDAGKGADQTIDIFHVEVESFIHPKSVSRRMRLLSFDRLSQYGKYRACVDERVHVKLCVCDITQGKRTKNDVTSLLLSDVLTRQVSFMNAYFSVKHIMNVPCLYHITREFKDEDKKHAIFASSFEVINVCKLLIFKVSVQDKGSNLKYSQKPPFQRLIMPFGVTHLGTAMRDVPYWSSSADPSFKVS